MHRYELVVIISPEVAEDDIPGVIDKVTQFISQQGGNVIEIDSWGKRKLAYPIKHHEEGDYVVARFELEPGKAGELGASLRLGEEFLRHLLIRVKD